MTETTSNALISKYALLGFEPKITASEAIVMPFHYRAMMVFNQFDA